MPVLADSEKQRKLRDGQCAEATTLSTSPKQRRPMPNRDRREKRANCSSRSSPRAEDALSAASTLRPFTALSEKWTRAFPGSRRASASDPFECPTSGWIPDSTGCEVILALRTSFAEWAYPSWKLKPAREANAFLGHSEKGGARSERVVGYSEAIVNWRSR